MMQNDWQTRMRLMIDDSVINDDCNLNKELTNKMIANINKN